MAKLVNKAKFTVEVEYSGATKDFEKLFKVRNCVNNYNVNQDSLLIEKIKYERTEESKLADQTKRIVSHVLKPAGFNIITLSDLDGARYESHDPNTPRNQYDVSWRWKLPLKSAAISISGAIHTSIGTKTAIEIRFGPADIRIIREPARFLIKVDHDPHDYWGWRNMDNVITVELSDPNSFQRIQDIVNKFYEDKVVPFIDRQ